MFTSIFHWITKKWTSVTLWCLKNRMNEDDITTSNTQTIYFTLRYTVSHQTHNVAIISPSVFPIDIFNLHPTIMQLTKMGVIAKLSKVWMDVGLRLDCKHSLLDSIQSNHSNNHNRCIQMFGEWLHHKEQTGGKPRTWRTLLEAVRESSTQGHGQEKEIERMLIERNEGR